MLAYLFPGISLSQLRPRNEWLSELGASATDTVHSLRPPSVNVTTPSRVACCTETTDAVTVTA